MLFNLYCNFLFGFLLLLIMLVLHFFFFKQKTAYDLRISDWSSDVCSSDVFHSFSLREPFLRGHMKIWRLAMATTTLGVKVDDALRERLKAAAAKLGCTPHWLHKQAILSYVDAIERGRLPDEISYRSEEHTSELQSLIRISYAVFCL